MLKILTDIYFREFKKNLCTFDASFATFLESSKELDFSYMIESSSVFSSNIEGNSLDLNSFMNARMKQKKSKDAEEIENLISAYQYAQKNLLNEKNFLNTHTLSSKTLLIKSQRGKYRNDTVGVFGKEGLIYLAIEAEYVSEKMEILFEDITILLEEKLSSEEVFYYGSLIHLIFVHIHPFSDGNGRSARLLEKWFVASKLGSEFWKISSEQYYKENRAQYYKNINLGVNYYELDYSKCLPFLALLPMSLSL